MMELFEHNFLLQYPICLVSTVHYLFYDGLKRSFFKCYFTNSELSVKFQETVKKGCCKRDIFILLCPAHALKVNLIQFAGI